MLQQALDGIEGESRVVTKCLFQAWNSRDPATYRDMLTETGTEEMGHVETYATAIALNLESSATAVQVGMGRRTPLVMGEMDPRAYLPGRRRA